VNSRLGCIISAKIELMGKISSVPDKRRGISHNLRGGHPNI